MAEKILIVEDDVSIRNICKSGLENDYEVSISTNGEEAMKQIKNEKFDVVITELKMSGIGGKELLWEVKTNAPNTDVIIITDSSTLDNALETTKLGAYDYVTKPFSMEVLKAAINRCFEKRHLAERLHVEIKLREELSKKYNELKSHKS